MATLQNMLAELVSALGEEDVAAMAGTDDVGVTEWLSEDGPAPDDTQAARIRLAHDALQAVAEMRVAPQAWFRRPAKALGGIDPITAVRMSDAGLVAAGLTALRAAGEQLDRHTAMANLLVPQAARLALIELGGRLGVERSRVEAVDPDGLTTLRTIAAYLRASGCTESALSVTVAGHQTTLDLAKRPEP